MQIDKDVLKVLNESNEFTSLDQIKAYMLSNNLESYNYSYKDIEFEFYIEETELHFSFNGPIWSSDDNEIAKDLVEDGNLDSIAAAIIEEGEEFTPPGTSRFEDGAWYRHDNYGLLQYSVHHDMFYDSDGDSYDADNFKKSDLDYVGKIDDSK